MNSQKNITDIIKNALQEDIGSGDVTSDFIVPKNRILSGEFVAKESGVIAGLAIAADTFKIINSTINFHALVKDGDQVQEKQTVARVEGSAHSILRAERVALNFLQRMSGIATITSKFVNEVKNSRTKILDTRKTVPGLRILDKIAVRTGGGKNHRFGLYDMILIKENHITAAGGIRKAVEQARKKNTAKLKIEVEVKNLTELKEAFDLKVDQIMLDNMPIDEMKKAVHLNSSNIPLEASGNVSLKNVSEIASTGVDYISVGQLTHSVKALDISLILN